MPRKDLTVPAMMPRADQDALDHMIDQLIHELQARAWDEGWRADWPENPYRDD